MSPSGLCVLIVDNDDDALVLSRHLVEKAEPRATVVTAQGAREAMGYLLRASNPDDGSVAMPSIMLLDVNMPGMNGFEVLRWVRRNRSLAALKVVMLSTSDSPVDINKASEMGAHGYLIKFPNPACLGCMLREAAGTDRAAPLAQEDEVRQLAPHSSAS